MQRPTSTALRILSLLCVQLLHANPVRVEVGGHSTDVAHVGVVDEGGKVDGAPVEVVEDLRLAAGPGDGHSAYKKN